MTTEDKQLLLKDLCAGLPYGVKINIYDDYSGTMKDEELNVFHLNGTYNIEYRNLRPYLRPMSRMTEEEYLQYCETREWKYVDDDHYEYFDTLQTFDWLNAHHFDYRGLIPVGLALEAPEGMYKID